MSFFPFIMFHPIIANRCISRYEQLTLRANALREELHTETTKMLNDVIKFKMHIQKTLEEYETFVSDEMENEMIGGSEEMRDDTPE